MLNKEIRKRIKDLDIELKISQICKPEGKEKKQHIKKIKAEIVSLEKQLQS